MKKLTALLLAALTLVCFSSQIQARGRTPKATGTKSGSGVTVTNPK